MRGLHHSTRYRTAGFVLVLVALFGYATVADELRHIGEFMGVTGLLVSGLALLAAGFPRALSSTLAVELVPVGVGLGMLVGALTDEMVWGVLCGIALGLLLAVFFRKSIESTNQSA